MGQRDDGPSALDWLLAELDRRVRDPAAKQAVLAILRSMVGQRVYLARAQLVRAELLQHALDMLDAGIAPRDVRARLTARGEFSRRTAERLVEQALNRRAPALHAEPSKPSDG